jgi:murein L,D-transpeptidase YafK
MPRLFRLCLCVCVLVFAAVPARAGSLVETAPASSSVLGQADNVQSELETELQAAGFELGAPAFIRIFKADSSLELWMLRRGRFELFKTYTICKWSGALGPKLREGDKQSPEGVYFITGDDLIVNARWHRAMNVGYPNARDNALGLTGSDILIHGKCTSIGCFALTDDVVQDVYEVVDAALDAGQPRIPVHIFPFQLTREKLAGVAGDEWADFWHELKRGHDLFLRDRLPPRTFVCNGRYAFQSRRERMVSLSGNPVCTTITRPARPALAALHTAGARLSTASPQLDITPATKCSPRDRRCRLVKAALRSSAPCPSKYGRCRNPQVAAVKSIDCPLKFPRCRKSARSSQPAMATLKTKRNSR